MQLLLFPHKLSKNSQIIKIKIKIIIKKLMGKNEIKNNKIKLLRQIKKKK